MGDMNPGSGEIIEYVFGFPRFRLRLKDVYKEIPMKNDTAQPYRTVTVRELEEIQCELRAREDELLKIKGVDYTRGGPNRIANFIEAGEALGLDPRVIWMVYFHKHVTAVAAWALTGHVESEALIERFADIRNYCLLGLALDHASRPSSFFNPEGGEEESS